MRQRGRKSSASLSVVAVDGAPPPLQPPPSLSESERVAFAELVASCDRRHFRASDMPLISVYVRAICLEERAARELNADPTSTRWLAIWEKAGRQVIAAAMRLRLSPQSRTAPRVIARQQHDVGPGPWAEED